MGNSARVVVDVGTVVADTYTIEALVGKGGMGSVFLATHKRLPGKQVAIKLLHDDLQDPEVIARFKREAEIATRLGHPNIVTVHDFNVLADGTPYLILEYLHGESLASRLRHGPLPLETVFSIMRQVGSALAAAHREGIIHRDLKPQNIFLVPTEVHGKQLEVAKVLDFGISKMRGSTTVKTQESTLLGTPQYMAPEQAKGDHANVDQRTDIFALGSIVYEMLAGHPAFSGENIPAVCFQVVYEDPKPLLTEAPSVPPSVVDTVNKAMAKIADERFPTVTAFIEQLTGEPMLPPQRNPSIPPLDDSPGSGKRSTGKEAFDKTMNSGEFGIAASTPRPRLPTPIPVVVDPAASPQAATMQSLSPPPADEPVPADRAVPAALVAPRRSLVPIFGIALASAAVGALVLYLVTRGGTTTVPDAARREPVVIATPPPDAAVVAPVIADAALELDAAPVVEDAAPVIADAAIRTPPDARVPDRVAPPVAPTTGPGAADLAAAVRALAARDWDAAERLAGQVIINPDSPFVLKAHARSIRGQVRCVARFNEEQAGLDLKAIPRGYKAWREQLIAVCRKAGYLKTETP
jgi:serine/threonine protein kinase